MLSAGQPQYLAGFGVLRDFARERQGTLVLRQQSARDRTGARARGSVRRDGA